jgi:hypothetical protein
VLTYDASRYTPGPPPASHCLSPRRCTVHVDRNPRLVVVGARGATPITPPPPLLPPPSNFVVVAQISLCLL